MRGVTLVLLWAVVSGCAGASVGVGSVGSRLSAAPARSRGADRAVQRLRGGGCSCFGGSATASQGDDWEGAVKEAPAKKEGQKPAPKQKTMLVRVRNSAVLVCLFFLARRVPCLPLASVIMMPPPERVSKYVLTVQSLARFVDGMYRESTLVSAANWADDEDDPLPLAVTQPAAVTKKVEAEVKETRRVSFIMRVASIRVYTHSHMHMH